MVIEKGFALEKQHRFAMGEGFGSYRIDKHRPVCLVGGRDRNRIGKCPHFKRRGFWKEPLALRHQVFRGDDFDRGTLANRRHFSPHNMVSG